MHKQMQTSMQTDAIAMLRTDGRTNGRPTHRELTSHVGNRARENDQLRILTVRQPWAWAIIHGGKNVENRVRNVAGDYRGPVAVHVGLAEPRVEDIVAVESRLPQRLDLGWAAHMAFTDPTRGHIIGVVDLVGVHVCRSHHLDSDVPDCVSSGTPLAMTCSPWAEFRRGEIMHHLVFSNPRPLAEPIPYRGALGLRRLPEDVAGQVWQAVAP